MTKTEKTFTPGDFINSWKANDYHPHTRGAVWYTVFGLVLIGVVLWSIFTDPQWGWFSSLSILFVVGVYCAVHKRGHEIHEVSLHEYGMFIDQEFVNWTTIEGFWFIYDETASVIHFQKKGKGDESIALQMGNKHPDFFRSVLLTNDIPELVDKQEGLLGLWIRVLKL